MSDGRVVAALGVLLVGLSGVGCRPSSDAVASGEKSGGRDGAASGASGSTEAGPGDPLATLRHAGSSGDWESAWDASSAVLLTHRDDPAALMSVAEAAFRTGRGGEAADLIDDAAKLQNYQDVTLVNRGVVAYLNVGRVFGAINLLRRAVRARPDDDDTRRVLFDLLHETEHADEADHHAGVLVRRRAFDRDLLLACRIDFRRTSGDDTLETMMDRNPSDRRGLIGAARTAMDRSEFDRCLKLCDEILASHPGFRPAVRLRWAAIGAAGDPALTDRSLRRWVADRSESAGSIAGDRGGTADGTLRFGVAGGDGGRPAVDGDVDTFWWVVGEHLREQGDPAMATRCLVHAATLGPDRPRVWSSLASLNTGEGAAARRAERLIRLRELQSQFADTHVAEVTARQLTLAADIVEALDELGQPWLAEAWAAYAISLRSAAYRYADHLIRTTDARSPLRPRDERRAVGRVLSRIESRRKRIVGGLRRDTPWRPRDSVAAIEAPSISDAELVAAVAVATGADPDAAVAGSAASIATRDTRRRRPPPVPFTADLRDEAERRGLVFDKHTAKHLDQPGIMFYATLGCGGGVLDFDRDGWPDIYLVAAGALPGSGRSAPNDLFRNFGGRFRRCTRSSGTGDVGFGQGMTAGDLDGDGWEDIVCLNYGRDTVYLNNGDGTFTDATDRWLPADDAKWSTSGAIADIDGDGLADLVTVRYCDGAEPYTLLCQSDRHGTAPDADTDVHDDDVHDDDVDDDDVQSADVPDPNRSAAGGPDAPAVTHRACSPTVYAGVADQIRTGSPAGGLAVRRDGGGMAVPSPGRGLGLIVAPLDERDGLDLFVANDMTTNQLWSFDRDADRWDETAAWRGLAGNGLSNPQGSMGIAAADLDGDDRLDLYVTNFVHEYNTLHLSDRGAWSDRTAASGLADPTLPMTGFGCEAVDVNGDGHAELIVTNGHVDNFDFGGDAGFMFQPLQIFTSAGDGTYRPAEHARGGYLDRRHIGRGLFTADVDRDGDIDVFVTHQSEPAALLINHTEPAGDRPGGMNFDVAFALVGTTDGRDAIGASVHWTRPAGEHSGRADEHSGRVDGRFGPVAYRTAGDGYLCRNEPLVRLPPPPPGGPPVAAVRWPDGRSTRHTPPPEWQPGREWVIVQPRRSDGRKDDPTPRGHK